MSLCTSLAIGDAPDQGAELRAICANTSCRHSWVVAYLPMALDRVVDLSKRAACPKCGDTEPRVLPTMPRQKIEATTAAACPPNALAWISGPDVGASSKAIWSHMLGVDGADMHYPFDPDDLGRCLRLLEIVPEWKPRIQEMATHSPVWAALVEAWDDLAALMIDEAGIDFSKSQMAPRTYARMRAIRDPIEQRGVANVNAS